MSDTEFPMSEEPEIEGEGGEESFDDAFSEMESDMNAVPQGDFIQLRNGANAPRFVPLHDGETSISVQQAIGRTGLTVGVVEYYVDNNRVSADYVVPVGGIVEIIGNVKGGM